MSLLAQAVLATQICLNVTVESPEKQLNFERPNIQAGPKNESPVAQVWRTYYPEAGVEQAKALFLHPAGLPLVIMECPFYYKFALDRRSVRSYFI